jgi:outer membrane biosynthesis protein TonB
MGSRIRPFLIAAPWLLAAPLSAQETEQPTGVFSLPPSRPAPDPNRQGPELDVYRDPVTPRATSPATPPVVAPPVVAPSVTPPPVATQPVPAQPARPRPEAPRAQPPQAERPAPTPAPAPSPATEAEETPAPANDSAPVETPAPAPPIAPADDAAPAAPPAEQPTAENAGAGSILSWLIGGLLALVAIGAAVLLLRRRRAQAVAPQPAAAAPASPPAPPKPTAPPKPAAAPLPPVPAPMPEAAAAPDAAERPWVDMDLVVSQARYSLMGVTVAYSLILHNRGSRAAQDLLVRGIIGNAGAQQQALLQGFFGGQDGLPLHSVVTIAPGETLHLAGELRLAPDRIVPVEMGQRSLLIPIAAFDAAYRWQPEDGEKEGGGLAAGRTARAFIVGQEQEPPTARLAPLRLDQGPRQYRRPAARAAAELAPA